MTQDMVVYQILQNHEAAANAEISFTYDPQRRKVERDDACNVDGRYFGLIENAVFNLRSNNNQFIAATIRRSQMEVLQRVIVRLDGNILTPRFALMDGKNEAHWARYTLHF